jgi:hypothetical protein
VQDACEFSERAELRDTLTAMSTRKYAMPVEATKWTTPSNGEVTFNWEYDEGRDQLLSLYEKGKNLQWNGQHRIDWSREGDLDNPFRAPDM